MENRARSGSTIKAEKIWKVGNQKISAADYLLRLSIIASEVKTTLVAMREDGNVLLMSRRGEILKNFPLDLDARLTGNYFLETGSSTATTYFVVVSRDGFRIKFNLEGKIQSREALLKTSPEATFRLISDENNKTYIIVRQDSRYLTVIHENLNDIITSDFLGNNPVDVQLFDFGNGKRYITSPTRVRTFRSCMILKAPC